MIKFCEFMFLSYDQSEFFFVPGSEGSLGCIGCMGKSLPSWATGMPGVCSCRENASLHCNARQTVLFVIWPAQRFQARAFHPEFWMQVRTFQPDVLSQEVVAPEIQDWPARRIQRMSRELHTEKVMREITWSTTVATCWSMLGSTVLVWWTWTRRRRK